MNTTSEVAVAAISVELRARQLWYPPFGYVAPLAERRVLDPDRVRRAIGGIPSVRDMTARATRSRYTHGRFANLEPTPLRSTTPIALGMQFLFGGETREPSIELPTHRPDRRELAASSTSGIHARWLGHSSVLLDVEGVKILTDPVFAQRIGPLQIVGPSRFHPRCFAFEDLPPLDAILISHDHYDHLDLETIEALAPRGERFVVPLGLGAHLRAWGIDRERIVELDWWERVMLRDGVSVQALPARHFSGRLPLGRNRTLWASFAIAGRSRRVFFSGDTGYHERFEELARAAGPFDLAMIEVGAFHHGWASVHLGPRNARRAFAALGAQAFLPLHWGTYSLALHHWWEPIEGVVAGFGAGGHRFATPRVGEALALEHDLPDDRWWRPHVRSAKPAG